MIHKTGPSTQLKHRVNINKVCDLLFFYVNKVLAILFSNILWQKQNQQVQYSMQQPHHSLLNLQQLHRHRQHQMYQQLSQKNRTTQKIKFQSPNEKRRFFYFTISLLLEGQKIEELDLLIL